MINIELPDMDFSVDTSKLNFKGDVGNDRAARTEVYHHLEQIKWKKGGVYFIYTNSLLLYVGRSINIKERLITHLTKNDPTTREQANYTTNVSGFYVWDIADQEIYETYAIKTLKPKLNKQKTHKIRRNYGAADNRDVVIVDE